MEYEGENGEKNYIVFYGTSPTIRLDGKKTMDSFMDKDLTAIVGEAVGNSGNGGSVTPSPAFGGTIDYICQYDETCFEFLNRLSWLYGEWFYYDGTTCYFGNPGAGGGESITYDMEMSQMKFRANLIPGKVNRYHYLVHDDKEIEKETPGSVPGVVGYHQVALGKSDAVYTSEADLPAGAVPSTMSELEDLVKAEKGRSTSGMLVLTGTTLTSKIAIGKEITFKLPPNMRTTKKEIGNFLIVEVTHGFDQKGEYYNTFKAIPAGMENIPMQEVKEPKAFPQIATVKTNEDEDGLGRVKVEFQWQKAKGKTTNWIRVQTPDAGKSDDVPQNRGWVFIPEKEDIVMVDFEYGDPNRPYVSGSIFSEKVSAGGDEDNKIKSITTRTGSTIMYDESEGSILIKDKKNSDSIMLLDGEKNIVIKADKSISLVSGKASIVLMSEGDGTIMINAKTIVTQAGETFSVQSGKVINMDASDALTANSKKTSTVSSSGQTVVSGQTKTTVTATGQTIIDGAIVKIN
ncbi:MAG: phage baseplate assembly protein V [Tannerellaceae bacterium]|nr:phage baseplate assembly protein V [Tannerellaceae bacterium]